VRLALEIVGGSRHILSCRIEATASLASSIVSWEFFQIELPTSQMR